MSSFQNHLPKNETVHDAAISWRVRQQARPLDDGELAAFTAWLDAAPEHQAAYAEIEELWQTAGELGQHPLYVETRERGPRDAPWPQESPPRSSAWRPGRSTSRPCPSRWRRRPSIPPSANARR